LGITTATVGAALLGVFRKFFVIGRRVGLTNQDILGESPDGVKSALRVTVSEGFEKLGIGLSFISCQQIVPVKICHPGRDD
jgi:hypothetical protein